MKEYWVQHIMDRKPRKMTLDQVFLEAMALSDGGGSEASRQDGALYQLLKEFPELTKKLLPSYKREMAEVYEYEFLTPEEAAAREAETEGKALAGAAKKSGK